MTEKSVHGNVQRILDNADELQGFAEMNGLGTEAARRLLERMLDEPQVSEAVQEYLDSRERSGDFQGYRAGEEVGYKRGHEAGFAKGAVVGALAVVGSLTAAGLTYLAKR